MKTKSVLIVGGYGVVGMQIASILRDRYPDHKILLGGRNPEQAKELAQTTANTEVIKVDTTANDPLQSINDNVILIINAVNDPEDHLLQAAVNRRIPFIDVTRWTENMIKSIDLLTTMDIQSPVILSSGWMAGVAALFSRIAASSLKHVKGIDINILY